MVDIIDLRPSEYTLEEAKEKFPDWYQRLKLKNRIRKMAYKRDLYDWWLRQAITKDIGIFILCVW